jgi:hypothetical protein
VSEIVPRANKKYVTQTPLPAALPLTAMEPTPSTSASKSSSSSSSSSATSAAIEVEKKKQSVSKIIQEQATLFNPISFISQELETNIIKIIQEDAAKKLPKSKFALFALSGSKDKDKDKEEKKKALTTVKNMAKGVGYSNYQQKGWDVKAYMAAQKEKDKQVTHPSHGFR